MTTEPTRPRTQITDPTGRHVAANVRRIRDARGWSTYELENRLRDAGRPIAASAIAKVERAERRVDAGDLVAFAVVFGVSPSALLLPLTREGVAEVTGAGTVPASTAWEWADGERPLLIPHDDKGQALLQYQLWGRPPKAEGARPSAADHRFFNTVMGRRSFADNLEAAGKEVQRYPDGTIKTWRDPGKDWVEPLPHVEDKGGDDGPSVD